MCCLVAGFTCVCACITNIVSTFYENPEMVFISVMRPHLKMIDKFSTSIEQVMEGGFATGVTNEHAGTEEAQRGQWQQQNT